MYSWPFRAGHGYNGPTVDDADAEAEVLEETPPVVTEALVPLEMMAPPVDVGLVADESTPVLPVTVSGTQERPKQMDPLVVYV